MRAGGGTLMLRCPRASLSRMIISSAYFCLMLYVKRSHTSTHDIEARKNEHANTIDEKSKQHYDEDGLIDTCKV